MIHLINHYTQDEKNVQIDNLRVWDNNKNDDQGSMESMMFEFLHATHSDKIPFSETPPIRVYVMVRVYFNFVCELGMIWGCWYYLYIKEK